MNKPLVACVMPTRDRPRFAAQAIRLFKRQTYLNSVLIIANGGSPLLVEDDRVKEVFISSAEGPTSPRASMILNYRHGILAAELTPGVEYIAFWEDDDWYHPRRLQMQVEGIGDAVAHGFGYTYYYHLRMGTFRMNHHPRWSSNCCTMLRKSWISSVGYPDSGAPDVDLWTNHIKDKGVLSSSQFPIPVIGIKHNLGAVVGNGHRGVKGERDPDRNWLRAEMMAANDPESVQFYDSVFPVCAQK